jgi:hypothetical protein
MRPCILLLQSIDWMQVMNHNYLPPPPLLLCFAGGATGQTLKDSSQRHLWPHLSLWFCRLQTVYTRTQAEA